MKVVNNPQVYCEPGTWYIGDLCYVLDASWEAFCKLTIRGEECLDGGFRFADGREFVSFMTKWGDGTYQDSDGFNYPVDAGLIGCVRVEDMDAKLDEAINDGRVHVFTKPFVCERVGNILYFGKIAIDLDPADEEEYEYE
jgi:hypothetical protein